MVAGMITQQSFREILDQRSTQPGGPLSVWPPLRSAPTDKEADQRANNLRLAVRMLSYVRSDVPLTPVHLADGLQQQLLGLA